jgi:uncharacterized membrane protein YfcA
MSGTNSFDLAIFMGGTFAAAFVTSVAGFAFGMIAAGIWLHVMSPAQSSILIVAYALLIQGHAVWNLRHAFNFQRLKFLLLGTTMGIPAGIAALGWISASTLRILVGAALILFCLYNIARPKLPEIKKANPTAETAVGLLNGIFGAATGLAGIVPTIWSGFHGWSRDEQRAVFQPTAVATFLMIILATGSVGLITTDIVRLFVVGMPSLIMGSWLGWTLYGKLDEAAFRKVVLVLLLVSGTNLVASPLWNILVEI